MVCYGRVGGSGQPPQVPYLNKNQKGVHGLQDALSRTTGQAHHVGTSDNKDLFLYRSKDPSKTDSDLSVTRDNKTGEITYHYGAKDSTGKYTHVKAFDFDGDGNIDKFQYADRADTTGEDRVYANPNDDGTANFQQESKGFSWNPLDWFK